MNIFVVNCGSSSIKYELFDMAGAMSLFTGLLEQIGEGTATLTHHSSINGKQKTTFTSDVLNDHSNGFAFITECIGAIEKDFSIKHIHAIGHRVVHGGEAFTEATMINAEVVSAIQTVSKLAPLHNPANLTGISVCLKAFPNIPQVAVFDTAFHQSIPEVAYRYALPQQWYQKHGVRRYGFHGTSHSFVAKQAASFLQKDLVSLNLITLHLGNGASAAAIKAGSCIDTSMGMTPLEGLVMGTRCGDIDPSIPLIIAQQQQLSCDQVENLLNKQSGLKGICGVNDMREVIREAEEGDAQSQLALEMYCYRIQKYIGAYTAILGTVDAVVFTAGIGENSAFIRENICKGLQGLNISLSTDKNSNASGDVCDISAYNSKVRLLAIKTDEELEIAIQTLALIKNQLKS